MSSRFKDDLKQELVGMSLVPKCLTTKVQAATFQQYADDLPNSEDLATEIHLWKTYWSRQNTESVELEDALQYAHESEMYPNMKAILSLMAVLPVTSCESEHSFNQLKLLKTSILNRMTGERLNGLILMKMHLCIAKHLDADYYSTSS